MARSRPGRTSHVLANTLDDNLAEVGPLNYDSEAVALARGVQQELGIGLNEAPFPAESEQLIEPQEAERLLREQTQAWQRNWSSDDYGEMRHFQYFSRPVHQARRARRGDKRVRVACCR